MPRYELRGSSAPIPEQGSREGRLHLPTSPHPASQRSSGGTEFLLNTPLQRTLSEFVRRTHMSLPVLVELVRGQTETDYCPNKQMVPEVLAQVCKDYQHLEKLQIIAAEGVRVEFKKDMPPQSHPPDNHGSATERVNILRKNVRKEQDSWRCLVLDLDLLSMWPEVFVSPFGIVDKARGDPLTSGRTIHDLSFPEGASINDLTDQDAIPKANYRHCDAVVSEIMRTKREHPDAETKIMAGDVTSAFRNVSIHSRSVHRFAGRIEAENALVIELACPFGWTGSPGEYEVIGGAIAFVHGRHGNLHNPTGFFNYHWVDDHVNVTADVGSNCDDMERSLHYAMTAVLGSGAVNEEKFTAWNTSQKILGLQFDSMAATVAMPAVKIDKARNPVASAYHARELSRKRYRSLMEGLRHVATCIRAARPFLQRLQLREINLHRFWHIPVCDPMKQDLLWWWQILHSPLLNGVALEYFNSLPESDVFVEMDACDHGLCALDRKANIALTYQFSPHELRLIARFKTGEANGFNINFRELLSCAFATHEWGSRWSECAGDGRRPLHVHFRIDNTSAVVWQNRLASRNTRAQDIIRLLGYWESSLNLRFSASHIAGVDNTRADAGSRIAAHPPYATQFEELTRGWT